MSFLDVARSIMEAGLIIITIAAVAHEDQIARWERKFLRKFIKKVLDK